MKRRIKTFEDACEVARKDADTESDPFHKIKIIVRAMNECHGRYRRMKSRIRYWYIPKFRAYDGVLRCIGVSRVKCCSILGIFPSIYYVSKKDAWFAANQFLDLYKEFLKDEIDNNLL